MAAIEEGKVCIRKFGKGSGEEVTITKVLDDHFVMVKDAKGKEKRSNIKHLEPVAKHH
ncbi:MAG: 50S ribosomal protein L14e [Candidatus Micrarchaeota archaeon]|nr:50S ribosomal protein L14e [Candidatus Micrarchaeota archaeon]NYZ60671.1 50S ribosomal protein L14e [Candidatus Micrarchaeota archaeon]